jgi:Tol biopolymer transport system component
MITSSDRLLGEWLQEGPELGPQLALERTLEQVHSTRQRPAWVFPERWIPMDLTMRRVVIPRSAAYLVVVGLVIAIALVAIAIVGSQHRLPAPFGPAANGVVVFATATGDIAIGDPATGVTKTLLGGKENDTYPVFSRDGAQIAFIRSVPGGVKVMKMGAAGGQPREITPAAVPSAGLLKWSPDSQHLAFVTGGGQTQGTANGTLWIANTDGSGVHALDLGFTVDSEVEWRPPNGEEILVRGVRDGDAGLFLVKSEGPATARALTPLDGGANDYLWLTWSPDGSRFAYSNHPAKRVHLFSGAEQRDVTVQPQGDLDLMFPRWSPDGARLAFMVWLPNGQQQIGVAPAADSTPVVTLTGPTFPSGIQHDWSPDGQTILAVAWQTDQPWIIDPAGGPAKKAGWTAELPDWIEWQRLAP